MRYKPDDMVISTKEIPIVSHYTFQAGTVGTVKTVTKRGVLVRFGQYGSEKWCRYSEIKKLSEIDEQLSELDKFIEGFRQ